VSVIIGISADSDFMLENAGYRILMEIAFARTDQEEDKRALEAQRIAWLLDEAAQTRIEDWREQGTEASLSGAAYYETFQSLLQKAYARPPAPDSRLGETPVEN
jgi:hypothetical protein